MPEHMYFNFEVDGDALKYIVRAMDKYIEQWPGGHPDEQKKLHLVQLALRKALLDYQILHDDNQDYA
tara:strand:- start:556 stop:756 length:201 start_codon:yes stop_codon:yes gene_type:complete